MKFLRLDTMIAGYLSWKKDKWTKISLKKYERFE